jgi:hypothetical protein
MCNPSVDAFVAVWPKQQAGGKSDDFLPGVTIWGTAQAEQT